MAAVFTTGMPPDGSHHLQSFFCENIRLEFEEASRFRNNNLQEIWGTKDVMNDIKGKISAGKIQWVEDSTRQKKYRRKTHKEKERN